MYKITDELVLVKSNPFIDNVFYYWAITYIL